MRIAAQTVRALCHKKYRSLRGRCRRVAYPLARGLPVVSLGQFACICAVWRISSSGSGLVREPQETQIADVEGRPAELAKAVHTAVVTKDEAA
jgi:hypothetical protein